MVHPTLTRMLLPARLCTLILIGGLAAVIAHGQDATPTPAPTEAEQRLIDANRLLELQKTNAELKKAIRDAQPQPSATPLEGKTTVDENVAIETQLMTFNAMSSVVNEIAVEIRTQQPDTQTLLIYNLNSNHINSLRMVPKLRPGTLATYRHQTLK